jgi:hypothetical protein
MASASTFEAYLEAETMLNDNMEALRELGLTTAEIRALLQRKLRDLAKLETATTTPQPTDNSADKTELNTLTDTAPNTKTKDKPGKIVAINEYHPNVSQTENPSARHPEIAVRQGSGSGSSGRQTRC